MRNLTFITWEVSSECNHGCTYCYNDGSRSNATVCSSDDNLGAISEFIVSRPPVSVTISGGEPLLMFDRLKPHIEKLRTHKILVRILSNGTLITEEIARFCAKWDIHFLISFPSADRDAFGTITGQPTSYDKALAGMDLLKKHGVAFQPNMVVTPANLGTVEETVRFLWQRYAPPSVMVSRATAPSGAGSDASSIVLSQKQLERMFDLCDRLSGREGIRIKTCGGISLCSITSVKIGEIFGKVCGRGRSGCVIAGNGDVRVCTRDSQVYGNIFSDPFEEICRRMAIWQESPIPEECENCSVAEICRGGCHMSSMVPNRGPGSLDCHAAPQRKSQIRKPQKRPGKELNPLSRYQIMPFVAVCESDCVRLSVGISYDYFPQEVVAYLDGHREITTRCALQFWREDAPDILERLMRIGAIQECRKV